MLFGDPANSAGALITGQMFLNCEERLEFDGFEAVLELHRQYKKPFNRDCQNCATQTTELKKWVFLPQSATLEVGKHAYPFSALLPGDLPATHDSAVLSVSYTFKAQATSQGSTINLKRHPVVKRSLMASDPTHQSQRMFPPTNIVANMFLHRVIHPVGDNTIHLRIDGLVSKVEGGVEMWKLKKLAWKLEESAQTIAHACPKHANHQVKAYLRKEKRIIAEGSQWEGWKTDYNEADGKIEMELKYGLPKVFPKALGPHACAFPPKDGTEVTHALTMEILLLKNFTSEAQPHNVQSTGDARVLRMRHPVVLTDDPGLGMSWDEEVPPIYDEVPPSPPQYPQGEEPTEFELLEPLGDHSRRPSYVGSEISGISPPASER